MRSILKSIKFLRSKGLATMLIIAMQHPSHCCVNSAFSFLKVFTTLARFNQNGSWNVKAHNIYSDFTACFFVVVIIQQVL